MHRRRHAALQGHPASVEPLRERTRSTPHSGAARRAALLVALEKAKRGGNYRPSPRDRGCGSHVLCDPRNENAYGARPALWLGGVVFRPFRTLPSGDDAQVGVSHSANWSHHAPRWRAPMRRGLDHRIEAEPCGGSAFLLVGLGAPEGVAEVGDLIGEDAPDESSRLGVVVALVALALTGVQMRHRRRR